MLSIEEWQTKLLAYAESLIGKIVRLDVSGFFQNMNMLASLFTIIGVLSALWFYFSWKKDYKLQKAHDYALDLMKKLKLLHFQIETLRIPKFHYPETVVKDIRDHYIPKINELIFEKALEIQADLLVAKQILVKNKDLQSNFNKKIQNDILKKIMTDIYVFNCERDISYNTLKNLSI